MKIGIAETLGYSILGIAIVFLMLIILMGIIVIMGKAMARKQAAPAAVPAPAAAPAAPAVPKAKAPGSAGHIDLHGVEPKTAAMLMAIVADEMGKPLSELRFISIKAL